MVWLAGMVVEVLVNWVGFPKHTELAVKLAVGFAYTEISVLALLDWLPTVMVQV